MIPIHQYNPNLTEIAEVVLLGPQATILEQINRFNSYYGTNLKCTKTFRWSPGGGDQIREAYQKSVLRWDMKYSGTEQFFKRIDNRKYTHNQMRDMLGRINTDLSRMRADGIAMQDNTQMVVDSFNSLKEKIQSELSILHEIVDSSKFLVNILVDTADEFKPQYVIKIVMRDYTMSIIDDDGIIAEIPLYPVALEYRIDLIKHINKLCSSKDGNIKPPNIYNNKIVGEYLSPSPELKFTYISSYRDSADLQPVCLGDFTNQITDSAYNFNLQAMGVYLEQWISKFHKNRTHPHNKPDKLFFGMPKWLTDQANYKGLTYAYPDIKNSDRCGVPKSIEKLGSDKQEYAIMNDTTCNDIQCALRDKCSYYNNVVNIDEDRLTNLFYIDGSHDELYRLAFHYRYENMERSVKEVQQYEIDEEIPVLSNTESIGDTEDMTDEERTMQWVERQALEFITNTERNRNE